MNAPAILGPAEPLPTLLERAVGALESARTSAEVLEAAELAGAVYDAAKRAARFAKAKGAHDDLISKVYRAQADALALEARAKIRLADEYDRAQERGELRAANNKKPASGLEAVPVGAEDAGLTHKQVHDARRVRDAERAEPGVVGRTLHAAAAAGREPTRAILNDAITKPKPAPAPKPRPPGADSALYIWGRINEFVERGHTKFTPEQIVFCMPDHMREDVKRRAPEVADFIKRLGEAV